MPKEIVVLGPPGTGKTTAMVTTSKGWFDKGVGTSEVAYLAFTKAAAREAASRILDEEFKQDFGDRLPYFRTLHSLAYMGLRKARPDVRLVTPADMKGFARWSTLEGTYTLTEWEDLAEAYRKLQDRGKDPKTDWDECLNAYTLSRISARSVDDLHAAKERLSNLACSVIGRVDPNKYKTFVEKYETYKEVNGLVDFTDMLAYALTEMEPLDGIKKVVIDEGQDISPILHSIISRIFEPAEEVWWAGDDDQCQPAGTLVYTAAGASKCIEDVKPGDLVVSYDRKSSSFVGFGERKGRTRGAKVLRTSKRSYTGPLYEVTAGNLKTRCTKEHKFVIRLKGSETLLEIAAYDLIPGMEVPIYNGTKEAEWVPISVKSENVKNIDVYSLDVEKTETYVADGISTHNSIFKFSAADAGLFIEKARRSTRIFLRQTHRFGDEVVDFSKKIISRVSDRVLKDVIGKPGSNHTIRMTGEFRPTTMGNTLLLHRHVAGCQGLAEMYIQNGLPFRNERGKNPLGAEARVMAYLAMKNLADGKTVTTGAAARLIDDLMPSMVIDERDGLKKRLIVHGAKKRMQGMSPGGEMNIMDLLFAKILTTDGAEVIRQKFFNIFKYPEDLSYYDRVTENGYALDALCPTITTMHGSKGREAERVVVFSEMGLRCWDDPDTEHRLAYVGGTRTKGELEICMESTLPWSRTTHYNYPIGIKKSPMTPVDTAE